MTNPRLSAVPALPKRDLSHFGILHMSVYIPRTAVSQSDLEAYDGAPSGKYTVGLGQSRMSFVRDREDVVSLSLTAVSTLLREAGVSPRDVGRVDVGTETVLDKSKSIKTSLMRLFAPHGNVDVDGLDATNACYGATAALFNALAWAESSLWDGRLAVVVAADIAVYAPGPARPTGGAAAVAILLGPDAPLRLEPPLRAVVMGDSYDFFKPRADSEYPAVRGAATVDTYVRGLDACYERIVQRAKRARATRPRWSTTSKAARRRPTKAQTDAGPGTDRTNAGTEREPEEENQKRSENGVRSGDDGDNEAEKAEKEEEEEEEGQPFDIIRGTDYAVFHSPFDKMVRKAFARLVYHDFLHGRDALDAARRGALEPFRGLNVGESHRDRGAVRAFVEASRGEFARMCEPGAWLGREIGNCYTGSVYSALAALLCHLGEEDREGKAGAEGEDLLAAGKRILVYSFGSGFAAAMFALTITHSDSVRPADVVCARRLREQVRDRVIVPAEEYAETMKLRERDYGRLGYAPCAPVEELAAGTWYLKEVDAEGERFYDQVPYR